MSTQTISTAPRVIMDELVYQKIMFWVNKSQYEVSGLGTIVMEPNNVIRVVDVMLLEQKNTSTTTDLDPAAVGKAAYELHKSGRGGDMKFWWHSHVNMAVFWSGTDVTTIKELAMGGWFVSTVFNKKRETKTCISMNDPINMIIDNVDFSVERVLPADLLAEWDSEYIKKVENNVPKRIAGTSTGNPRYQNPHHNKKNKNHKSSTMWDDEERDFWTKPDSSSHKSWKNPQPLSKQPPKNYSAAERKEIAQLAKMMTDEEVGDPIRVGSFFMDDQDGPTEMDGFGDLDWPGAQLSPRSKGEHDKPMLTPQEVIDARNRIEDKIEKMEDRILTLKEREQLVPNKLAQAMLDAEEELADLEEELDALEGAGLITEEQRYADKRVPGRNVYGQ